MERAIIAIEDKRFYTESGVDILGIARAFLADVTGSGATQGASTITEQLVKLIRKAQYNRTIFEKLIEAAHRLPARAQVCERQGQDPRRLPQRRLLRQRRLGHRGGGADLLRQRPDLEHVRLRLQPRQPDQPVRPAADTGGRGVARLARAEAAGELGRPDANVLPRAPERRSSRHVQPALHQRYRVSAGTGDAPAFAAVRAPPQPAVERPGLWLLHELGRAAGARERETAAKPVHVRLPDPHELRRAAAERGTARNQ